MLELKRAMCFALIGAGLVLLPASAFAQGEPPGPRATPNEPAGPAGASDDAPSQVEEPEKGLADADVEAGDDALPPPPPLPGEEAPAPAPPAGDVITLKNGKVLQGVQVVRETPTMVLVQVVPGVEPMNIPRKQVASMELDDLRAEDIKEGAPAGGGTPGPGMDKGETSMELAKKLGNPVVEEAMRVQRRDVLEVLQELAQKAEVPIDVEPEVQQLQDVERQWNTNIPEGTSFMTVLRDLLPKDFPQLDSEITADKVIVKMKGEEENGAS